MHPRMDRFTAMLIDTTLDLRGMHRVPREVVEPWNIELLGEDAECQVIEPNDAALDASPEG